MVGAGGVDTVLVADHLPELGTDLVTALTTLDMNDLTHLLRGCMICELGEDKGSVDTAKCVEISEKGSVETEKCDLGEGKC
jgi:hypothetical protein